MTGSDQPGLFDSTAPVPGALPDGFRYHAEFISPDEEQELVRQMEPLPLREFEFHGFVGKRRVVSFGWRYDFNDRKLRQAEEIPPFLLPLRDRAAAFAGLAPAAFDHVLMTEYSPGAAIGWHKDKAAFGDVVGISLLSPCRFSFRRKHGSTWRRAALTLEPRSAYLLTGPSRTDWEHSIPAVERLRYSITFRQVR